MTRRFLFVFIPFLLILCTASAQDSTSQHPEGEGRKAEEAVLQRVVLHDGSELVGHITDSTETTIRFRTMGGATMELDRSLVREIVTTRGEWSGNEFIREDPNRTRLFLAPTARAPEPGQGYFSVAQLFFPQFAVGVADFFALGGGMSLLPGAPDQIFFIAPKVRPIHAGIFDLAAGVIYVMSTAEDFDEVGVAYGVATLGSSRAALTVGLGWGFSGDEFSDAPVLVIGGELRLSNSVKLISENWVPPETEDAVVSFGIRFFGRHLAADFGLIHLTGASGFPFFPWLGFTYNFGP